MLSFKEYIAETYVSIGFKKEQEQNREKYRKEIHDILQRSYSHPSVGGYGGITSGSPEESKSINSDISKSKIKAVRRNGKITAVRLYKDQYGRKSIASGTDGTEQGKRDFNSMLKDDKKMERAWAEASGGPEKAYTLHGFPKISSSRASELTGKTITRDKNDPYKYKRKIGDKEHEKTIFGYPKKD